MAYDPVARGRNLFQKYLVSLGVEAQEEQFCLIHGDTAIVRDPELFAQILAADDVRTPHSNPSYNVHYFWHNPRIEDGGTEHPFNMEIGGLEGAMFLYAHGEEFGLGEIGRRSLSYIKRLAEKGRSLFDDDNAAAGFVIGVLSQRLPERDLAA